ncbi:MAG TPA: ATP-binding protein [Symbiobacteriaceae bacterium]|nr:ATP-binding protein [Symbiobacteriaceae bacterium]
MGIRRRLAILLGLVGAAFGGVALLLVRLIGSYQPVIDMVRAGTPGWRSAVDLTVRDALWVVGALALLLLILAIGAIFLVQRHVEGPVQRLVQVTKRFSAGDLRARVAEEVDPSMALLARTFNEMAEALTEQREDLLSQRDTSAWQTDMLGAMADANPDAAVLIDPLGEVAWANAAYCRTLGRDRDELIGIRFRPVLVEWARRCVDPDGAFSFLIGAVNDPEFEGRADVALVEPDRRDLLVLTLPVRNRHGGTMGRLIVHRDVTQERAIDRLKSEMVSTVSHEIRTPLAAIYGFAELLLSGRMQGADAESSLQMIYRESRRLNDLVSDFLDMQRLEQGREIFHRDWIDLEQVIHGCMHRPWAGAEGRLCFSRSGEVPTVWGDEVRMAQVVENLLSNALKYSPSGGPVEVTLRASGERVRVEVADRGLGVPDEAKDKIFTRFYRVDSKDRKAIRGTGLGLAIAAGVLQAHGGAIGVLDRAGGGSIFWFELPVAPASA